MRSPLLIALGCLVLLLPGCGGDDEEEPTTTSTAESATGASGASGGSGERGKEPEAGGEPGDPGTAQTSDVTRAIEAVVGGDDPEAACVTYATAAYVKRAYGDEQGCRAAVTEQGSFGVQVEAVEVSKGSAEATAVADGGPNEGEQLSVRLDFSEGEWQVSFLRSDAPAGP